MKYILLFCALFIVACGQDCPMPDGMFPDLTDCSKYFICANDVKFPQMCSAGSLFDQIRLTCNNPVNVDCGNRPLPGSTIEPTTPHTTTTRKPVPPLFPDKVLGLYLLLADDTAEGFTTNATWDPLLYTWQQTNANVLFLTFINPKIMVVPYAFESLAKTRGTGAEGAVPADTKIIFAIGGYYYSLDAYNPWPFLISKEAAEEMSVEVATWPDKYGCDGIDLDIEDGAGDAEDSSLNMAHFVKKLKSLKPNMIITQPTYGQPAISAEVHIINESWEPDGSSNYLAESVGLMVYDGTGGVSYLELYTHGSETWTSPVSCNVPSNRILLGCMGAAGSSTIMQLAQEVMERDLLGIMVWYASVRDGLIYQPSWDASQSPGSISGYGEAMALFKKL